MTITTRAEVSAEVRRYRFAPLDRAGVLLGLNPIQCGFLGAALLAAGIIVQVSGSIPLAVVPVAAAGAATFARWQGRNVHEWIVPAWGWLNARLAGAHNWQAAAPLRILAARPATPEFLRGLELLEAPHPGAPARARGMGLIADRDARMLSATLRVHGREFALLEPGDQHRVLDAWGDALAGFCRERSAVARLAWSEWAAPASLDDHLAFVRTHHPTHHSTNPALPDDPDDPDDPDGDLAGYLALVAEAGPLTTAHEVLVTLTVDRTRTRRRAADPGEDPAVDVLAEEVALFARRLDHAGLTVDGPLAPAELAHILRLRLDPACAPRLARRADTLGEAAGVVSPHNWAPVAVSLDWRAARVDQSWHRTFWIAEWPRLEVPADWMAPLVLHAGGIRTLTLVYEPIAPSRSRRAIDRDATRLASDEDQRTRHGFRIRAQHRRAEHDVLAREAELVAGYPELAYAGFLTITAPTREQLDVDTAEWEQVAAQSGLEIRALDGQHDLGLATALPIGRAPALRRTQP